MALNITFTCNEVVDENGDAINCKYQAYYPEHNHWNDVRDTELYQYNCNAGDGDALTQTGSLLSGQHIILAFWQGGNDRTGLKDRMSYYVITHDGVTNTYVIDVELKPKTAPSCNWYLTTVATINRNVTAYTQASDEIQWSFEGTTHYHKNKYSNEVIFDSIGDLTETYDFGEGDGYDTTRVHSYVGVDDYTALHKVINEYSLESICEKPIRLKYNTPIGCLTFSPDGVGSADEVSKGDSVDTTACITDEDNRIIDISHSWIIKDRNNNSTIIRDTLVDINANISYTYTSEILELQDTFAEQYITWNDGWEDRALTKTRELVITNILPEVSISKTDLSSKEKRFTQTSSDEDGTVVWWEWKIYLLMPFSGDWVEVWSNQNDGTPIDIQFNEAGNYKTKIKVRDDFGGYNEAEIEYDISASGNTTCSNVDLQNQEIYFIFPDVI